MYYGWWVVGGVFIAQMFQLGFTSYTFGLLVVPIETEFEASRAQLMYGMTVATVLALVLSPAIGALVDKRSIRALMCFGALILAGGLFGLSLSQGVYSFALIFGISMSLGNLLLGPLTGSATVARWFSASRGRALGIAAIGVSVGGILMPVVVSYWLDTVGWRVALQYLALTVLLIVFPYLLLFMRGRPEDMGMHAEGSAEPGSASNSCDTMVLGTGDIVKIREFWLIGIILGILFAVYSATVSNLPAYAAGHGASNAAAGKLLMVIALSGLVGKLIFGFAADKIKLKYGLWLAQALVIIAMLLLASFTGYPGMLLACGVLGLAAGGMLPIWGAMMATVFGVVSYGRVMGLMMPLISLMIMPSFQLAGFLYDISGSYASCFVLFAAATAVGAVLLARLRVDGRRLANSAPSPQSLSGAQQADRSAPATELPKA